MSQNIVIAGLIDAAIQAWNEDRVDDYNTACDILHRMGHGSELYAALFPDMTYN